MIKTKRKNRIRIKPEQLDEIFENATTQEEYMVAIYNLVLPVPLSEVKSLEGWPTCHPDLWGMICERCMAFDQVHAPRYLPGGAWMNSGFSVIGGEKLKPDEVSLANCTITYQS